MVHAICRVLIGSIITVTLTTHAQAQTAAPKAVVIGSLESRPNAILFLNPEDKNQGFLLPQLTTAQRLSINAASPGDDGLMVYDREEDDVYLWRNNAWVKANLGDGGASSQVINTIQFVNNEIRVNEGGIVHAQSLNTMQVNGDVSGSILATSVGKIQGNAVSSTKLTAADNGKAMVWNGTQWAAHGISDNSVTNETLTGVQLLNNDLRLTEAGNTLTQNLNGLTVAGDAAGTINTLAVTKIQGNPVNNAKLVAADNGKAMVWNGTQWTAQGVVDNSVTNETLTGVQLLNNDLRLTEAGNTLTQNLNGLTVAGDAAGTINTLAVTKIQGNPVNNAKLVAADNGKALVWNGTQWTAQGVVDNSITNETLTGVQLLNNDLRLTEAGNTLTQNLNGLNVTGDVTGTINTSTVTKIQGNPINNATLLTGDNGKVLTWDGGQWVAQTIASASPTTQYATVDPSAFSILKERGKADKSNIAIFEEDDSFVTIYKSDEAKIIIAPVSLPHGATLQNIVLHYMARQAGNIRFRLLRKPLSGANEEVVNWVSTGVSNTVRTASFSNFGGKETIQNEVFSYRIEITLSPPDQADEAAQADHRIYGIGIQYMP